MGNTVNIVDTRDCKSINLNGCHRLNQHVEEILTLKTSTVLLTNWNYSANRCHRTISSTPLFNLRSMLDVYFSETSFVSTPYEY